jgi:hypothetical protein
MAPETLLSETKPDRRRPATPPTNLSPDITQSLISRFCNRSQKYLKKSQNVKTDNLRIG